MSTALTAVATARNPEPAVDSAPGVYDADVSASRAAKRPQEDISVVEAAETASEHDSASPSSGVAAVEVGKLKSKKRQRREPPAESPSSTDSPRTEHVVRDDHLANSESDASQDDADEARDEPQRSGTSQSSPAPSGVSQLQDFLGKHLKEDLPKEEAARRSYFAQAKSDAAGRNGHPVRVKDLGPKLATAIYNTRNERGPGNSRFVQEQPLSAADRAAAAERFSVPTAEERAQMAWQELPIPESIADLVGWVPFELVDNKPRFLGLGKKAGPAHGADSTEMGVRTASLLDDIQTVFGDSTNLNPAQKHLLAIANGLLLFMHRTDRNGRLERGEQELLAVILRRVMDASWGQKCFDERKKQKKQQQDAGRNRDNKPNRAFHRRQRGIPPPQLVVPSPFMAMENAPGSANTGAATTTGATAGVAAGSAVNPTGGQQAPGTPLFYALPPGYPQLGYQHGYQSNYRPKRGRGRGRGRGGTNS